ncbi:DNA endonuclease RBBP8 [Patella vulgata]|uniref:DNA endonuclease RBBP8 n=1 Tax=Patella vulgata TaxID=6465 RepID=UPI0024A984AF|nr:DNA endonuclease RBBP8 [Patella vulgata]XP_055955907.1 DNA endonuclease RBBP8 [Patella vulgata]
MASLSGKTEKVSIEQALKEVFYIHRNTVKEYQSELGQWIEKYEGLDQEKEKLMEQIEGLEKKNAKLEEEKNTLSNSIDKISSRNDDKACTMCSHLQQSMKVVQDAYKQTLEEKDNMIKFLKEQLAERSGHVPLVDMSNQMISREVISGTPTKLITGFIKGGGTDSQKKKPSPDSTVNSAKKKSQEQQQICKQLEEDGGGDNLKNDKLRFKNKRARHKEDVSPTYKKLKFSSGSEISEKDRNSSENTSPDLVSKVKVKVKKSSQNSTGCAKSRESATPSEKIQCDTNDKKPRSNRLTTKKKTSPSVINSKGDNFVPETCFHQTLNNSCTDEDMADSDHGEGDKIANIVVPETLGMETYSSYSDESDDDLNTEKTVVSQIDNGTSDDDPSKSKIKAINHRASKSFMDNTTDILNSPVSDTSEPEINKSRLHPSLNVSVTENPDKADNELDDIPDSGYTSRIEKLNQTGNIEKSQTRLGNSKSKTKKHIDFDDTSMKDVLSENSKRRPLRIDIPQEMKKSSTHISPVFTRSNDHSKNKMDGKHDLPELSDLEEPVSPLLLQSGKCYKPQMTESDPFPRVLRNSKSSKIKKIASSSEKKESKTSSQELNQSKSKKRGSSKNAVIDIPDSSLKQTTLSQVFNNSPKMAVSSVESELERKKIEEAIKLSLLEFQTTSQEYNTKKQAKVKQVNDEMDGIEMFKKPLSSTKMSTPRKRRPSANKQSPLNSPNKNYKSPNKSLDPDETVAPSPDSQPIIPLRRSPRKSSPMKSYLPTIKPLSLDQSLRDLDETVAPSPIAFINTKEQTPSDGDNCRAGLNRSIGPDVRLTQYCEDSESIDPLKASPTLKKQSKKKLTTNSKNTRQTLDSTLNEESQSLPCSSKSFKFGARRTRTKAMETQEEDIEDEGEEEEENGGTLKEDIIIDDDHVEEQPSFDSSFDRVNKKKDTEFAHVKVVKKQDERRKLKGHSCKECYEYYKSTGMSEDEIQSRIQDCSRHRADYIPPDTPEHFWSIGFPDTQECHERGYAQIERNTKPSNYRRKRQLQKKFKSKVEDDGGGGDVEQEDNLIFK